MTFELRTGRYLTCFYCNKRSARKLQGKVPKWDCTYCGSTNHLDSNGLITDPPASASSSSPARSTLRYAHARSPSPPSRRPSNDVFCKTCVSNQHIVRESLAQYLPPDTDPQYAKFSSVQEQYRADLERRYPPVCSACAPRVRERIKRAAYVARTDHLRRMVERTRSGAVNLTRDGNWRSLLFRIAGLCWWTGSLGEICWHTVESLLLYHRRCQIFGDADMVHKGFSRTLRSFLDQHVSDLRQVQETLSKCMPLFLCASALTLWWNNRMRAKYLGPGGRMVNLGQYYILQLISMGWKMAAWWLVRRLAIQSSPFLTYDTTSERILGLHGFMTLFTLLTCIILSTLVRLDTHPVVSFHITDDMILPEVPQQDPLRTQDNHASQHIATSSITNWIQNQTEMPRPKPHPLSADLFGRANHEPEPDAMDWSPTTAQPSYNFRSRDPAQVVNPGPSPFVKAIPAAPKGSFSRGIVPNRAPLPAPASRPVVLGTHDFTSSFRRRAPSTTTMMTEETVDDNSDNESTVSHLASALRSTTKRTNFQLAPPRFFPAQNRVDTGLETMFDQAFSIQDAQNGQQGQTAEAAMNETDRGVAMFDWKPPRGEQPSQGARLLWFFWSFVLFGLLPASVILGGAFAFTKFVRHDSEYTLYGVGSPFGM